MVLLHRIVHVQTTGRIYVYRVNLDTSYRIISVKQWIVQHLRVALMFQQAIAHALLAMKIQFKPLHLLLTIAEVVLQWHVHKIQLVELFQMDAHAHQDMMEQLKLQQVLLIITVRAQCEFVHVQMGQVLLI